MYPCDVCSDPSSSSISEIIIVVFQNMILESYLYISAVQLTIFLLEEQDKALCQVSTESIGQALFFIKTLVEENMRTFC